MRRDDRSPKAYRRDVSGEKSRMLGAIREIILEEGGHPEEGMGHGMLHFSGVGHLAAQKHHVALYLSPDVLACFGESHFPGVDRGKGCLRFRRMDQIDRAALAELLGALRASPSGDQEAKG